MTYFVYGAEESKTTWKVEMLLTVCRRDYKLFLLGRDYTREQLNILVPGTVSKNYTTICIVKLK